MSKDIVKRLCAPCTNTPYGLGTCGTRLEAADAIEQLRRERDQLQNTLKLHAGDCMSLSNEVDLMKSHWDDAEARYDALAEENKRLKEALKECADDLEAEINDRTGTLKYPGQRLRYNRDMEPVVRARAALEQKTEGE